MNIRLTTYALPGLACLLEPLNRRMGAKQTRNRGHVNRLIFVSLCALALSACQTPNRLENWPDDIPPRQLFVDGYKNKRNVQTVEPRVLNAHLGWIVRFYKGTTLYPQGWNRITTLFLDDIDDQSEAAALRPRLYQLGIKIANEWSHDNNIRLINSRNMLTWGNAIRTAAELDQHSEFIAKVESDVDLLLAGEIDSKQINVERYFPPDEDEEDFDDF